MTFSPFFQVYDYHQLLYDCPLMMDVDVGLDISVGQSIHAPHPQDY